MGPTRTQSTAAGRTAPPSRVRPTIAQLASALRRPGNPPAGWPLLAGSLLAATALAIAALVAAGLILRGDPGRGFAEGKPGTWLSTALLVAAAVLCARAAWTGRGAQRAPLFWASGAALFLFLAADERWMLHERTDFRVHHLLGADPTDPLTDHLDDAIVAAYGLVAAASIWFRRALFLAAPWTMLCGVGAAAFFGSTVLLDFLDRGWNAAEEGSKLMAEAFIVAGLLALRRAPVHPARAPAPPHLPARAEPAASPPPPAHREQPPVLEEATVLR